MNYQTPLAGMRASQPPTLGGGLEHVDMRLVSAAEGSHTLFGDILAAVRRRRTRLIVWILVCLAGAGGFLLQATPEFVATTQIVLEPRQPATIGTDAAAMLAPPTLDSAQADSQVQVVRSERNLRFVFDMLNLAADPAYQPGPPGLLSRLLRPVTALFPRREISAEEAARMANEQAFQAFADTVTVRRLGQSYMMEVSIRGRAPKDAKRLANAVTMSYIRDQVIFGASSAQRGTEFLQGRIINVQVEKDTAAEGVRTGTIPDFQFVDSDARVVSAAVEPLTKTYPQTTLILLLAGVLATTTGIGVITVLQGFDRTIRSREQVGRLLGIDCICALPRVRGLSRRDRAGLSITLAVDEPDSDFARTLRVLRATLFSSDDAASRVSVGIASCLPGEGRSTIAANLAVLLAASREGVLLIDADLRNPEATRRLAPQAERGLNEALLDRQAPRILPELALASDLAFVPAVGAGQAGDPNVFLGSSEMRRMMDEATRHRDVIIDLPPLSLSSDAQAIGRLLTGVILIAAVNRTSIDQLAEAIRALHAGNVRVLGVVLNKLEGAR